MPVIREGKGGGKGDVCVRAHTQTHTHLPPGLGGIMVALRRRAGGGAVYVVVPICSVV